MPKRLRKKAKAKRPAPKKKAAKRKPAKKRVARPKPKAKAAEKSMDEVQAAHDLLARLIGSDDTRKAVMREMGRKGGRIGGKKRLEWPKERRVAAAKRAAEARWAALQPIKPEV